MDERSLRRKLRQLKEVELIVRYGTAKTDKEEQRAGLIWNTFFKGRGGRKAKYPFELLLIMNNEGRRRVFADYLYTVYTEVYKEKGMLFPSGIDYQALFDFDLPANATNEDIKRRFRELAKIAHPDHGGSNEAMVALLEQYKKLMKD